MADCVCKSLVGTLNINEASRGRGRTQSLGGASGRDGHREEIGRDRVSPLMDNDSPKSQIKGWTTASIMLKTTMGLRSGKATDREKEGNRLQRR